MRFITTILAIFLLGCAEKEAPVETGADFDFDAYLEKANHHLEALTDGHRQLWDFGSADRWDADQETGIITWTFPDGVTVEAPFQIVGTYNSKSGTFLWGWDHPSVAEPLRKDAEAVRQFAVAHELDVLQDRKLECDLDAAWELAALATLICDRQGAYRGPAGPAFVFMTFGEVEIKRP